MVRAGRIDLLIRWPLADAHGRQQWQREAMELEVWRDKQPDPRDEGLRQLDAYLTRLDLDHGVLVLFDRRSAAPPLPARIAFDQAQTPAGRQARILRA